MMMTDDCHRREVQWSTSILTSSPMIMSAPDVDETSGRNSIRPRLISPDNFHISVLTCRESLHSSIFDRNLRSVILLHSYFLFKMITN